jgi:16S rRNA (cytosine967-C5)-methyltransferase
MIFLQTLRPDWETPSSDDPVIRAKAIGRALPVQSIFTCGGACSADIDVEPFVLSHLKQPDLFIRIRPGREKKVIDRLQTDAIPFQLVSPHSIALGNSTSLESRFVLDEEVVVQDLSSQRISDLFSLLPDRETWKVWDACAASGGKSILLFDHLPKIDLLCTDVRPSILRNLSTRLGRAGVPVRQIKSDDLSVNRDRSDYGSFDLIVADVPCSGSGTWARTPEQLSQFDERSIEDYSILQRKILSNLIPQLAPNGYLLYLTCSVFAQENEEQVNYLMQKHSLISVEKRMIKGYLHRADSMFAALFQRSA